MILWLSSGLWVGWVGRLDRNSTAPIFKVDDFLERTIHLEPDLVLLECSDDFVAAVRLWVGWVGRLDRNSTAAIFKVDVFLK